MTRWFAVLALTGCQCGTPAARTPVVVRVTGVEPTVEVLSAYDRALGGLDDHRILQVDGEALTAWLRVPGDARLAVRDVSAAVSTVSGAPERASVPQVYIPPDLPWVEARPVSTWDRAAPVADARVRALSRAAGGAEALTDATVEVTWALSPRAVVDRGLHPDRLFQAFADLPEPAADAILIDDVRLGDVAEATRAPAGTRGWFGAKPAGVVRAADPSVAPDPDWQSVPSETCLIARGPEVEAVRGVLPDEAVVLVRGDRLEARMNAERAPPADALPDIETLVFPCDAPPERLALVARTPDADLDVAVLSLIQAPATASILPVHPPADPQVELHVDPQRLTAAHVEPVQVLTAMTPVTADGGSAAMGWAGTDDPDGLAAVPVVTDEGVVLPLGALAEIKRVRRDGPLVRVDGREAVLVDVRWAAGTDRTAWAPPSDVEVVPVGGLGPEGLGLVR